MLLDLSPDIDSISHQYLILIHQILFHTQGNAQNLFKSYISNRTHTVSIQDSFSSILTLKFCVPKGSSIDPVCLLGLDNGNRNICR